MVLLCISRKRTAYQKKKKKKLEKEQKKHMKQKDLPLHLFQSIDIGSQNYYNHWWKLRCWKLCNVWPCL